MHVAHPRRPQDHPLTSFSAPPAPKVLEVSASAIVVRKSIVYVSTKSVISLLLLMEFSELTQDKLGLRAVRQAAFQVG